MSQEDTSSGNRRKEIADQFYKMLLTVPYPSISVMELCTCVGISRSAFYKYYPSKEVCLMDVIDQYISNGLLTALQQSPNLSDSQSYAVALLDYWKNNPSLLDIVVRDNLDHLLLSAIIRYFSRENQQTLDRLNTPMVQVDLDILACCVSCFLVILLRWHARDFDSPSEDMAQKLRRIMHMPLLSTPETIHCE